MKKKELKRQLDVWRADFNRQRDLVLAVSLQRDRAWREIEKLRQLMQGKE